MHLTELKKILDYAINRHWINEYPQIKRASEVKQDKEIEALSREEIEKLLEYANEKQALYLCLMIFTGMRPGEAVNITWDNISLEKDYIDVISDNRLKTGRRIPLHSKLKEMLLCIEPKSGDLSPFKESTYARKSMERLERITGIKCNPYKLRKTFGSILAAAGADTIYVAKLMGHSKLQTTYQYYLRLNDENLKNAIEKM
ncbi:MAG: hypothetical protein A2X41_08535 [Candidatus Margulisbacteria bacterium GWE2_39_32]|nr:MAG: hypothetical protein A2X41_08535 [Candidatus Margulisbacteria bacterium GWE2_39_32]